MRSIPVETITPGPFQPRRLFHEEQLDALATSIARSGVMQPILVRPKGEGYELVAGERRWRAAMQVGLETVPAIIKDMSDIEAAEAGLVENVQRSDLNPLERAEAFARLSSEFGLTHKEIAERVGIERSSVSNLLRLLELELEVQQLIAADKLSLGHAKALLSIPAGEGRVRIADRAVRDGWTVRRLELESKQNPSSAVAGAAGGSGEVDQRTAALRDLEGRLSDYLGTRVSIRVGSTGHKGRLEVAFYSLDHFDGLMERIGLPADG